MQHNVNFYDILDLYPYFLWGYKIFTLLIKEMIIRKI